MASGRRKRTVFTPDPRFDATEYVIPFYHEKNSWSVGETYRVRVSNVYDPSKFWIVAMDTELSTFQTSMMNFYEKNQKQYKLRRAYVKKYTYCVVLVNNGYFRAIIVNKPHGMERKIPVFLIDFGFHEHVKLSSMYHFHESYFEVPRFGVRARLSTVKPYDGYAWTNYSAKRFDALVRDKIFTVKIGHVDPDEKVVYITPQLDPSGMESFADIAKTLIEEKFAKKDDDDLRNTAVCKVLHFLPTFDIIESGASTNLLKISEMVTRNTSTLAMVKVYLEKETK